MFRIAVPMTILFLVWEQASMSARKSVDVYALNPIRTQPATGYLGSEIDGLILDRQPRVATRERNTCYDPKRQSRKTLVATLHQSRSESEGRAARQPLARNNQLLCRRRRRPDEGRHESHSSRTRS